MFVLLKNIPKSNKRAVHFVSLERIDSRVKQAIVHYFDIASDYDEVAAPRRIGEQYNQKLIEDKQPNLLGIQSIMDLLTTRMSILHNKTTDRKKGITQSAITADKRIATSAKCESTPYQLI